MSAREAFINNVYLPVQLFVFQRETLKNVVIRLILRSNGTYLQSPDVVASDIGLCQHVLLGLLTHPYALF